ncbi:sulfoxide reductase heme-binding subunit YedZ [Povalibacter uvarum]|uniref:Protein-methionine-sulfoxide reductase heme-binding subunit MsrQ n=1 Tax=Povalibacter uvarum TaxID=732238 RepID=A0A841HI04_9GAMM|nr:protein-methionine-sulfoxide reductase heme-binding subunit MsrQ [Povalibacter uvarum]MBB6092204.1 sulfoxide reductase heme-binding subunit YedZ [Povalibacter uvarum]
MPSATIVKRVIKPAIFVLCSLPLAWLALRAFGVAGSLGANPVEEIQDTLGEWGLRLLVITLAVTPLRDWFNAPWLILLRRMLGVFAFAYVLLHFLTWLILDQGLYWPGILPDIAKRPFITIGFAALLLLIPLAVTSTNAMMRRLGKRWKSLHRLIYIIVPLGVWHYWWQVKADIREPLIYAAIVAVLLGWRFWKAKRRRSVTPAHAGVPSDPPDGLPPARE